MNVKIYSIQKRFDHRHNMHQMIENGTRGVICRVTVQYAKANNEYTTKNFNKNTNEATFINDYDANNF